MAHMDNTTLANKKNRIGKSKLQSELQRLDKEQKTEIRMLNNKKQRFKCKYSSVLSSERRGTDPSNVVMYETHNPGFCYRRNGECRITQSPITNTSLGIDDIHALIFSQQEVDVDKVLCLHLLSAHRTETLTPPLRSQRTVSYASKEHSPLERLIERSKRRHPEDKLMKLLPVYILDVTHNTSKNNEPLIRDGRLAHRLIINEKVVQLVRSVMHALSNSNQDKLTDMVEKSKNKEHLKFLLCSQDMQEFIGSLNGLNIISCCESFYLTVPFKMTPVDLEVKTPNGHLERLILQIRKNIFKPPISSTWHENFFTQDFLSSSLMRITSPSINKEKELYSQNLEDTETSAKISKKITFINSGVSSKSSIEMTKSSFVQKPSEQDIFKYERKIRSVPPKRLSNDKPASLIQECLESLDENKKKENSVDNVNLMDFEKIAQVLCKKVDSANKRDLAEFQRKQDDEDHTDEGCAQKVKYEKYSLKQTTCPACLQKWRVPLPSPKTSKIRKLSMSKPEDLSEEDMATNSTHMISKMIDEEFKNWNNYNARNSPLNSPSYSPRSNSIRSNAIEIIDMDDLDLAKIRQEIRENETRKKLNKFLGERNI